MKEKRRFDFGKVSTGQMMQLWSIAARTGEVWDLLLKIINGDVTPPPQLRKEKSRGGRARKAVLKSVKSAANFTHIGNIEDEALISLLTDVVNGHSSLQRLNDARALVKPRMKVQTVILQDPSVRLDDWEAAEKKYPLSCREQFAERWAVTLVRERILARASLPGTFFPELERRIASGMSSANSRNSALVCPCLLILMDSS